MRQQLPAKRHDPFAPRGLIQEPEAVRQRPLLWRSDSSASARGEGDELAQDWLIGRRRISSR